MAASSSVALPRLLCLVLIAPAALSNTCPPLQSSSVNIECRQGGQSVDCAARASPPGTVASFRCRPLHHFLFDYLPAAGYESHCQDNGEWSAQPFRCVPICGRPTGQPTPLVRGGEVVPSATDFPWHVTIYEVVKNNQICGGSLITDKYFVSAAHCFYDHTKLQSLPATMYIVALGKTKRDANVREEHQQFRELKMIRVHEDYGATKLQFTNDIALVELAQEVDITAWALPVCVDWGLTQPELRDGEEGTVIGFGGLSESPSEELKFARLPFVHADTCRKHVNNKLAVFSVLPDKFCVGSVNRTTVGKGDSGGGLAFPDKDRQWFLRGVVSVGSPQEATYSFFSDVSIFVHWMSGIIRQGEVSGRRCGVDVSETSVTDGKLARLQDFPWEVDVYFREPSSSTFERLWTGILVKPNLVITVWKHKEWHFRTRDLADIPVTALRIAARKHSNSVDIEKATYVSEVVQTFAPYEEREQTGMDYNVILLELKQPLNLMPVCVDWTGSALVSMKKYGIVSKETPVVNPRFYTNFGGLRTVAFGCQHSVKTTMLRDSRTGGTLVSVERIWKRYHIQSADQCKSSYLSLAAEVDIHNLCTVGDKVYASVGLLVNVDNTWFLRGVLNRALPYVSPIVYTDVTAPPVLQWLAKTQDFVGMPTCGNVDLCQPLTPGLSLPGHMPWTVAVVVSGSSGVTAQGSGLLVHPGAVITGYRLVANTASKKIRPHFDNDEVHFPKVPAANITILSISADGKTKVSRVVHVNAYKDDLALLELDPQTPIHNTPVCLDLSGNSLQVLQSGQLGLAETWHEWRPGNHSLVSAAYLPRPECSRILVDRLIPVSPQPYSYSYRTQFCARMETNPTDPKMEGGAFLVRAGAKWFVQGLFVRNMIRLRENTLGIATDFSDQGLRTWLKGQLEKIKIVPGDLADKKRQQNCVGNHAPALTDCGMFVPRNEFGAVDERDTKYLEQPSVNHMEWYVTIKCGNDDRGSDRLCAGALVHPKMVLTTVFTTLNYRGASDDQVAKAAYAKTLSVSYFFGAASEEVSTFYEARSKCSPDDPDCSQDLVLLVLRAAVPLVPVCVPMPGAVGATLPPLTRGTQGLVETNWRASHLLYPVLYWPSSEGECAVTEADEDCADGQCDSDYEDATQAPISDDEFCGRNGFEGDFTTYRYGAPYTVRTNGTWYLRGVLGGRQLDNWLYINLDSKNLLVWLQLTMRAVLLQEQLREDRISTGDATATVDMVAAQSASSRLVSQTTLTAGTHKCGHFVPWDAGDDADLDFYLANPTVNHMEWHVRVHLPDYGEEYAGALVTSDRVLTFANVFKGNNPIEGKNIVVHIFPAGQGKNATEVKVKQVDVRERGAHAAGDFAHDLALLQLEQPVSAVPVCVPGGALPLPPLAHDAVGLAELSGKHLDVVAPVRFRSADECNDAALLAAHKVQGYRVADDKFCGEMEHSEKINIGAPFVVLTNGSWFIRGVQCVDRWHEASHRHWSSTRYLFCSLDKDALLWLDKKLRPSSD